MLQLKDVDVYRGEQQVLSKVTVDLRPQQITSLIGPNGSGKSTLLQLLTKALEPRRGIITGRPLSIALLAQRNELHEPLTVRELLTMTTDVIDDTVVALLQLTTLLETPMPELSGGQQQLAWLGFVLQQQPELVILDEPTTYLDLQYQHLFLETLRQLQQQRQFTVIMVLHDLTQAFAYSDQIWLLNDRGQLKSGAVADMADVDQLSTTFKTPLTDVIVNQQHLIVHA
ncbi:ABC transporter ATP-binding protein [Weissella sp. MSCH1]|uniref:ABC transporter ATP-binding protein n=1 Tax=Weissella sp. MSCH1 TaxID=3383343 RepID=UPI003896B606